MKFDHREYANEYNAFMQDMRSGGMPRSTGGMTGFPGLFIYSVARIMKATKILEIGTRNGISAATFARALTRNGGGYLISCDIVDVESGKARPGIHGEKFPLVPSKMIEAMGDADNSILFHHESSLTLLPKVPPSMFDIILLDGSHREDEVYREVPLALRAIRKDGILLLDDVYPDGAKLKAHSKVIPGPWLALARLVNEGVINRIERPEVDNSVAYVEK